MLRLLTTILRFLGLLGTSHHLPLGHQSPAIPVAEVQGFLEPERFFNDYVISGTPVVFKGAARKFPAFSKWSDEYFLSLEERWVLG